MTITPASVRQIKIHRFAEAFLNSAIVLLLAFALALGWFNLANMSLTPPHDPLSGLTLRLLFWLVGGLFLAVSLFCLGVRSCFFRVLLVAWLAVNFEVYQLGLFSIGSRSLHTYFGYVSPMFGVPSRALELFVQGAFLCFLIGSLLLLFGFRRDKNQARAQADQLASGAMFKNYCPSCGGHILFSAINLGQKIPCPHCQCAITLRKPDNLKMSCFFCQGHIEFPAHAIGQKLKCPHCHMDIGLKEPA